MTAYVIANDNTLTPFGVVSGVSPGIHVLDGVHAYLKERGCCGCLNWQSGR